MLVFQGGHHPRKMKHIIRVGFQNQQAMNVHTSLRGAKTPKIEKKGCAFGDGHKIFGKKLQIFLKKACEYVYTRG